MSFSSEVSSFPGGFPTDGNDGQDVDAASQPKNIADVASGLKNSIADALAPIDGTAACISRQTATDMRVKIVVALRLSSIAYCKLRSQGNLITSLRDPIIAAGQVAAMIPILLVTAVKLSRSCTAALFWFAISLPVTVLTGIATGCKSVGRRIAAPFHAAYTRSPFYAQPTPQLTGIWSYMPALLTPSLFSSPVYGLFRTPGGRHMSRLQFLLPGVRTVLRVGGVPAAHVDMASYVVASYPILFLAAVGL